MSKNSYGLKKQKTRLKFSNGFLKYILILFNTLSPRLSDNMKMMM